MCQWPFRFKKNALINLYLCIFFLIANELSGDDLKVVAFLTSNNFIKYSQLAQYGFRLLIALIYNLALGG